MPRKKRTMRNEDPMYGIVAKYSKRPPRSGVKTARVRIANPGEEANVPVGVIKRVIQQQAASEAKEAATGIPGRWVYTNAAKAYIAGAKAR